MIHKGVVEIFWAHKSQICLLSVIVAPYVSVWILYDINEVRECRVLTLEFLIMKSSLKFAVASFEVLECIILPPFLIALSCDLMFNEWMCSVVFLVTWKFERDNPGSTSMGKINSYSALLRLPGIPRTGCGMLTIWDGISPVRRRDEYLWIASCLYYLKWEFDGIWII